MLNTIIGSLKDIRFYFVRKIYSKKTVYFFLQEVYSNRNIHCILTYGPVLKIKKYKYFIDYSYAIMNGIKIVIWIFYDPLTTKDRVVSLL